LQEDIIKRGATVLFFIHEVPIDSLGIDFMQTIIPESVFVYLDIKFLSKNDQSKLRSIVPSV